MARVMEAAEKIDVLMTAAGVSSRRHRRCSERGNLGSHLREINVKGTYLWIRHAIQPMIAARSGAERPRLRSSQSSLGKNAAYVASKGAMAGSLHQDHRRRSRAARYRVYALMPGVIDTPMPARSGLRQADPEAARSFWKQRPAEWAASASRRRWRRRRCS